MTDTESYTLREAVARMAAALCSLKASAALAFVDVPFIGSAAHRYAVRKTRESFAHQMDAERLHREFASLQHIRQVWDEAES